MQFCAPDKLGQFQENGSCYDKSVLEKIARAYNRNFPKAPIKDIEGKDFETLWKTLQRKLKRRCGKNEVCWVSQVGLDYDNKIDEYLRPKTPADWKKDPKTWLTNFNIEAVMYQYQEAHPSYKFLGVFPVDFQKRDEYSQCLYEETCNLNLRELYEKGVYYLGMIINLDRHDEPGSHWTSLFVCINPNMPCFGAYYYDSVGTRAPPEMALFMKEIAQKAEAFRKELGVRKRFRVAESKEQHQKGNTECGVFSIFYQLRWLLELRKDPKVSFEHIVKVPINDGQVYQLRKILFRPMFQHQLKKTDGGADTTNS